jgi:hypothetical protein
VESPPFSPLPSWWWPAPSAQSFCGDGLGSRRDPWRLALVGAFIAYDQTLETPEGELMGRKAATVALVAHSVFSILSFTFVFPVVMGALT